VTSLTDGRSRQLVCGTSSPPKGEQITAIISARFAPDCASA
jgi:hypothetical protein